MRGRTVAVALLLIASVVAPAVAFAGGQAAAQSDVPRGMVGVPSSNINDSVPDHAKDKIGVGAGDLEGSVMTSDYAESLQVSVTTEASAQGKANRCNGGSNDPPFCDSPEVAITLTDDQNHAGRHVALPKDALADELGYVPELAYVEHSSGERYTVPIAVSGDLVVVEIDEFSTNTVTFAGTTTLSGDPSTDGAQFTYETKDQDSVDNFSIDVTGATATSNNTLNDTNVGNGSTSITVGGNTEPEGKTTTEPQVTVDGDELGNATSPYSSSDYEGYIFGCYSGTQVDSEIKLNWDGGPIEYFEFKSKGLTYGGEQSKLDVYLHDGDVNGQYGDGTQVANGRYYTSDESGGWVRFPINQSYTPSDGTSTIVLEIDTLSCDADSTGQAVRWDGSAPDGSTWTSTTGDGYSNYEVANDNYTQARAGADGATTATVKTDAGTSKTVDLSGGDVSKTVDFDMSTAATSFNWSSDGVINYTLEYKEITQTKDPTVEINGNTTSYTGTLSDGTSTSLTTNTEWVREGTNRVNVSLSSPSNGPTGQVTFDYVHDSKDNMSVSYEGETWTERYNVSRTFADDRSSADLTVPFASDRVVAVRDAEYRTNGGSWNTITESDRTWDGSTLVMDVGSVSKNDTVEVRANGSKVRVPTGEIKVIQPTTEGDSLATEIELTTWSSSAYIEVSGSSSGNYVHYADNESWSSPSEYVVVDGQDRQEVYFPGASDGATARLVTMPLDVDTPGDVRVEVDSAGYEPKLDVKPADATGDDVTWNWEHSELSTGTDYVLYSLSNNKVVDQDTASSPITLKSSDADQNLQIQEDSGGGGSSGGDGGGSDGSIAGPVGQSAAGALNSVPAVLLAWGILVAGMFVVSRRVGSKSGFRVPIVDRTIPTPGGRVAWLGGIASGVFVLEFLGGGQISGGIASFIDSIGAGLSEIAPFFGIVMTGILGYYLYKRFIQGQDNTIVVRGGN